MRDLVGKTAVVTGAASGIGLAVARRLAGEGMRLVLADIEEAPLREAEESLASAGREVLAVRTDVSVLEEIEALAAKSIERFGAVHVVHNNAGVVVGGPIETLSIEDWEWVLGVDLWSVIYGIRTFLPLMREAGEGHMVSTASTAGLVAPATIGPYSVSKFGVVALSETLYRELGGERSPIGVSVLCPGPINTKIVQSDRNRPAESARTHTVTEAEKGFIDTSTAMLARGMDPADVADIVLDGIRERRFWLLTHAEWHDIVRQRVDAMIKDGSLTTRFV